MGYSLFWLAVKGKALPDLLAQFALAQTGETEEIPESDIVASELPSGWSLILWNRGDLPSLQEQFAAASSGGHAVFCFLEEHVMSSACEGWTNGNREWSVRHNATWRKGNLYEGEALAIDGEPPNPFQAIRARLESEQEKENETHADRDDDDHRVDFIFDIPVDLAEALTGFRHDKDIPGVVFQRLKSTKSGKEFKPSLFRRIFSK